MDLPIELGPCSNGEYDPAPLSPVAREARRRGARRQRRERPPVRRLAPAVPAVAVRCRHDAARHQRVLGGVDPAGGAPATRWHVHGAAHCDPRSRGGTRRARGQRVRVRRAGSLPGLLGRARHATGTRVLDRIPATGVRRSGSSRLLLPRPLHGGSVPSQRHVHGGALGVADRPGGEPDVAGGDGSTRAGSRRPRVTTNGSCCTRRPSRTSATSRPTSTPWTPRSRQYPIVCWKVFTNFPDLYDGSGNAWRLDDGDPALARVGEQFVESRGRPGRADHRRAQGTVDDARLPLTPCEPVRLSDPRRSLHRDARFLVVPLRLRGRRRRGTVRPAHPRPRRQPAHHHHARRRHRAERERVRRAGHDVVVTAGAARGGGTRPRQAAALRR